MTFVDDLALVEVLIGLVAVLFCYVGVWCWYAIRTNDLKLLKDTLKSSAVPVGGVGAFTLLLAAWGEMTWPFAVTVAGSNVLAGYNIFFLDVLSLFGIVCVAYAISAYFGRQLHQVGLLALVAGVVTAFYGYVGYNLAPSLQYTKDPWDTFLLYGAFGAAALAAFPAALITDYYLHANATGKTIWQRAVSAMSIRTPMGSRAAQPVTGVEVDETTTTETTVKTYRVHWALQVIMLAFPALMVCAAVASFWYFGTTLPGHLGSGAAKAP